MLGNGREYVQNSPTDRKLAAPGHHVDAGIGQIHELAGKHGEVVAPNSRSQRHRFGVRQVVGEGLQGSPYGCHDHNVAGAVGVPLGEAPNRRQPFADGLRTGAEPFVRKGFPRRKFDDLGAW